MIIGLFPNEFKSHSLDIAKDVSKFLKERGTVVVTEDHLAQKIEAEPLSAIDPQKMAFRISLGGDGTILRLVHRLPHLQAPLLGINLGNLGFLADIPLDEIYPSLQELLDGHYTIQARMMMEGVIAGGEKCYAVNEIVVHRSQNPSLIDLCDLCRRPICQYVFRRRDHHLNSKRIHCLFIICRRPHYQP